MKSVKFIFATLGLVLTLNACAPEHEDVTPQDSPKLEKFDVKSTDGNDGGKDPGGD